VDNAACESFMKTLKYEEVHRNEYRDLAERGRRSVVSGKGYNQKRLISALGYVPRPESKSSQHNKRRPLRGSFFMSLFRHGNLSIDVIRLVRERRKRRPRPHRLDEFRLVIPRRVALQQSPLCFASRRSFCATVVLSVDAFYHRTANRS